MNIVVATQLLAPDPRPHRVGWIAYVVIGALAGWMAGKFVKGGGSGILLEHRHRASSARSSAGSC